MNIQKRLEMMNGLPERERWRMLQSAIDLRLDWSDTTINRLDSRMQGLLFLQDHVRNGPARIAFVRDKRNMAYLRDAAGSGREFGYQFTLFRVGLLDLKTRALVDRLFWSACLEIDPDGDIDGHGGEAVMLEGAVVGSMASVVYGHTVGKILAFAYVKPRAATPGTTLEVVIAGQPRAARVLAAAVAVEPVP